MQEIDVLQVMVLRMLIVLPARSEIDCTRNMIIDIDNLLRSAIEHLIAEVAR